MSVEAVSVVGASVVVGVSVSSVVVGGGEVVAIVVMGRVVVIGAVVDNNYIMWAVNSYIVLFVDMYKTFHRFLSTNTFSTGHVAIEG